MMEGSARMDHQASHQQAGAAIHGQGGGHVRLRLATRSERRT
jgi:hypothetical protein